MKKQITDKNGRKRMVWVLSEADRAGLVLKQVGTHPRTGRPVMRYVRAEPRRTASKRLTMGQREQAFRRASELIDRGITSPEEGRELSETLKTLTRTDIDSLKRAHELRTGGRLKEDKVDRLVAYAQKKGKVTPPEPGHQPEIAPAPLPAVERRRRDLIGRASMIQVSDKEHDGAYKYPPLWERLGQGRAFAFRATNGHVYRAEVAPAWELDDGAEVPVFVFADKNGSFAVTGAGGAVEVFNTVTAAAAAVLQKDELPGLYFTAAEPSRVRLYDRLVKSLGAAVPGYTALAVDDSTNGSRRYMLVKTKHADAAKRKLEKDGETAKPITFESDRPNKEKQTVYEMAPEIDESWFIPEGWPPLDDALTDWGQ